MKLKIISLQRVKEISSCMKENSLIRKIRLPSDICFASQCITDGKELSSFLRKNNLPYSFYNTTTLKSIDISTSVQLLMIDIEILDKIESYINPYFESNGKLCIFAERIENEGKNLKVLSSCENFAVYAINTRLFIVTLKRIMEIKDLSEILSKILGLNLSHSGTSESAMAEMSKFYKLNPNSIVDFIDRKFLIYHSDFNGTSDFNFDEYSKTLKTRVLGQNLVWTSEIDSSWRYFQDNIDRIPSHSGFGLVSEIQTSAVGRGKNCWISNKGCAMITFEFSLKNSSQKLNLPWHLFSVCSMQHFVCLAIVLACKKRIAQVFYNKNVLESYSLEELDKLTDLKLPGSQIKIKWPNDIYAVDENGVDIIGKLGGILTKAISSCDADFKFIIGFGVNVSNQKPTLCLNDLLEDVKEKTIFTSSTLIAEFFNIFESLMDTLSRSKDLSILEKLQNQYTKMWLHTDQIVKYKANEKSKEDAINECKIIGIDHYGYLMVSNERETFRLMPNGNTFDLMQGLISQKQY